MKKRILGTLFGFLALFSHVWLGYDNLPVSSAEHAPEMACIAAPLHDLRCCLPDKSQSMTLTGQAACQTSKLALDIKVINSLGHAHIEATADDALAALDAYHDAAMAHHDTARLCADRGITYMPMVFSSQRGVSKRAEAVLHLAAFFFASRGYARSRRLCLRHWRDLLHSRPLRRTRHSAAGGGDARGQLCGGRPQGPFGQQPSRRRLTTLAATTAANATALLRAARPHRVCPPWAPVERFPSRVLILRVADFRTGCVQEWRPTAGTVAHNLRPLGAKSSPVLDGLPYNGALPHSSPRTRPSDNATTTTTLTVWAPVKRTRPDAAQPQLWQPCVLARPDAARRTQAHA